MGALSSHGRTMAGRPEYADIQAVRASNGALYLFSFLYLTKDHAESLAEWEAMGQFQLV